MQSLPDIAEKIAADSWEIVATYQPVRNIGQTDF